MGWHIDRNRFDAMLCDQARRAGVDVRVNQLSARPVREKGGWLTGNVHSQILVDATGRNGVRIDDCCSREHADTQLAIVLHCSWPGLRKMDLRTSIETTRAG